MEQASNDVQMNEEDLKWLGTIPEILQPAARRHGRKLFVLVMQAGTASHILQTLAQRLQKNIELLQMVGVLTRLMNDTHTGHLHSAGFTDAQFQECKEDVERIGALADAGNRLPSDRVSKGGIILDS